MKISHSQTEDPIRKRKTELVERKGLGHPDSICDGIAERVSRGLCKEYLERFDTILHYNTDEAQLVAGQAQPQLGGGETTEPIYLLLCGRATCEFQGKKIPVDEIAKNAAKDYIQDNFEHLKPKHFEIETKIGETSTDLEAVYEREETLSNDTSFGVGHAPLSQTEKIVKKVEKQVRNLETTGSDVKVMGLREKSKIKLTVAAPAISTKVESIEEYKKHLRQVKKTSEKIISEKDLKPELHVNTADNIEEKEIYITETGTSAEMGDDGSVGRGNRVNGVITPHRSMSMEAASGKNPVTHVGKIYNLLAREIAQSIHQETGEFAQVKMLSQIGAPINKPELVEVETPASKDEFREIIQKELENIDKITRKCVKGEITTF